MEMSLETLRRLSIAACAKLFCRLALCVTVLSGAAYAGAGQWAEHGPNRHPIYSLAIDPSNVQLLYAGGDGGIWRSTDGGIIWTFLKVGASDISMVHHLAIDSQNSACLYASTASDFGGGRLFKSTDGGETWSFIHTSAGPYVLVVDPDHPDVLYAGVYDVGFLKSVDGGCNWTMIGVGPGVTVWHIKVSALVLDPTNPAILYAGDEGGVVLKSPDAGATWVNILEAGDNGPVEDLRDFRIYSVTAVAVAPISPTTLYVGTEGRGVLKSTDGGTTWKEMNRGLNLFVRALAINPTAPAVLYAATNDGDVSTSTDGGSQWTSLHFRAPSTGIHALAVNPTGTVLYVGTDRGVSTLWLGE